MPLAYLTERELAERWRMTVEALREYRRKNPVPTFRRSARKSLFPVVEIEKYEQARMLKGF